MHVLIALSEPAALALAFVVGLCVGSFLNVVVHRLPRMLERDWRAQCAELAGAAAAAPEPPYNLVVPRSACPACGHAIGAHENIPVLSWLALRGKCSACKAPISARYPLVELVGGVLAAFAVAKFGLTASGIAAALFLWALLALTFIDFDTQLLPDDITLPLLWGGLLAQLLVPAFGRTSPSFVVPLPEAVIGAVAGYLSLWLVYWAFKLVRGKEGMGYGDFKLLAALGAWLGWQLLVPIILLSSVVGAAIGLGLIAFRGRDHTVPLAFGPYLAIAGGIALFYGPQLLALEQSFLR
ncbi:MAG TPA: A24 family peptidase [Casimicrobiaceae bacterium]|nr:A24 family peptidase [Casimicrobiaceae bacterium]